MKRLLSIILALSVVCQDAVYADDLISARSIFEKRKGGKNSSLLFVDAVAIDKEIKQAFLRGEVIAFTGSAIEEIIAQLNKCIEEGTDTRTVINSLVSGITNESNAQTAARQYLNGFLDEYGLIAVRDALSYIFEAIQNSPQRGSIINRRIVIFTGRNPLYFRRCQVFAHAGISRDSIYLHLSHIDTLRTTDSIPVKKAFRHILEHEDWHLTDEGKEANRELHAWQSPEEQDMVLRCMSMLRDNYDIGRKRLQEGLARVREITERQYRDAAIDPREVLNEIGRNPITANAVAQAFLDPSSLDDDSFPGEEDEDADAVVEYAEKVIARLRVPDLSVGEYKNRIKEAVIKIRFNIITAPLVAGALIEAINDPRVCLNAVVAVSETIVSCDTEDEFCVDEAVDAFKMCLQREDFRDADAESLKKIAGVLLHIAAGQSRLQESVLNTAEEILRDTSSGLNLCYAISEILYNFNERMPRKIRKSTVQALFAASVRMPLLVWEERKLQIIAGLAGEFALDIIMRSDTSLLSELGELFCSSGPSIPHGFYSLWAVTNGIASEGLTRNINGVDYTIVSQICEKIIVDPRVHPSICSEFFARFSYENGPKELPVVSSVTQHTVDAIVTSIMREDVREAGENHPTIIKPMHYGLGIGALAYIRNKRKDLAGYITKKLFEIYRDPRSDVRLKQYVSGELGIYTQLESVADIDDFKLHQRMFREVVNIGTRIDTIGLSLSSLFRIVIEAPEQLEQETLESMGILASREWLNGEEIRALILLFVYITLNIDRYAEQVANIISRVNDPVISSLYSELLARGQGGMNASMFSVSETLLRPKMENSFTEGRVIGFKGNDLTNIINRMEISGENDTAGIAQLLVSEIRDEQGSEHSLALNFILGYISTGRNREYLLHQFKALRRAIERSNQKESIKQRRIVIFLEQQSLFSNAIVAGHAGIKRNSIYLHIDHIENSVEFMHLVQHEDWHLTDAGKEANKDRHQYQTEVEEQKVGALLKKRLLNPKISPMERIVLSDDLSYPVLLCGRDGKEITIPPDILRKLKEMTKLARKLRVELPSRLVVKNGTVTNIFYPDDETKIAIIRTNHVDERNDALFYNISNSLLSVLKYYAARGDSVSINARTILQGMLESEREMGGDVSNFDINNLYFSFYSISQRKRYEIGLSQIDEYLQSGNKDFIEDILNIEYLATQWWSFTLYGLEETGESIKIHNHPVGHPSPPSTMSDSGDIYVNRFMEGHVNGLILDDNGRDVLYVFYEPDSANEGEFRRIFNKFWEQKQPVFSDLDRIAMKPYRSEEISISSDFPDETDSNIEAQYLVTKDAQTVLDTFSSKTKEVIESPKKTIIVRDIGDFLDLDNAETRDGRIYFRYRRGIKAVLNTLKNSNGIYFVFMVKPEKKSLAEKILSQTGLFNRSIFLYEYNGEDIIGSAKANLEKEAAIWNSQPMDHPRVVYFVKPGFTPNNTEKNRIASGNLKIVETGGEESSFHAELVFGILYARMQGRLCDEINLLLDAMARLGMPQEQVDKLSKDIKKGILILKVRFIRTKEIMEDLSIGTSYISASA